MDWDMHDDEEVMEKHVLGLATEVLVMAIVISVMLLFLGIGVLVLIHACIVGRTMRGESRERETHMEERGSLGSTSMSRDDIEKLPCFDVAAAKAARGGGGGSPAGDCAVCLEGFKVGERCRLLPSCNHSFHADCVDLWLLRTPICPICRAAAGDEREDGGGGGDERESGGGGGGDLGLNQTVVDAIGFDLSTESQRREAMDSSERVVEMRERDVN